MYQPRYYREQMNATDLVPFSVLTAETDLKIFANKRLKQQSQKLVKKYREQLQHYICTRPEFNLSLKPIKQDFAAPPIAQHMIKVSQQAKVGPMASVAGAIAQYVGNSLLKYSNEIIIENGGDIFMANSQTRIISVHCKSLLRPVLLIDPLKTGQGICTSSGTLGHSLSYGKADAVVVRATDTLLADAAATSIANKVKTENDINNALCFAKSIHGINGVLIIINNKLGAWGNIKFKE